MSNFAEAMMKGYDSILKEFATSWLGKGVTVDMTGPSVEWFQTTVSVVSVFLVTIGLMFAGIKVMRDQNGRPARDALETLAKVAFVSFAGSLAIQVFVVGGDAFGKWILAAAGLDTSTFVVAAGAVLAIPGLAIILGLFGILTVLCQWALMFIRGAVLPLLAGFWPVAAAAAMLEGGKKSFDSVTQWLLAFVIYSPLAASIYAMAWRLKNGQDGIGGVVSGWILIVLAVAALPALMRVLAPVASALGKMAGGVMAMGITAAVVGAGVAIGAAVFTGGASAAAGASGAGGAAGAGAGGGAAGGGAAGATAGGGAAGGGAAGGGAAGGEGAGGANGQDGGAGKHAADGADGSSSNGPAGGSSSTSGSTDGGGGAAGGASGTGDGGNGGGSGWQAAQGALDGGDSNDGGAEGMVTE
ncbi:hypothetical protein [Arthrobacter sp. GAS37]|uniref:hypothetical protein n=1 Tax=Arthrobacter sp. GAS37 TaxID=3156261 RepID=UPI00384BC80E